MGPPTRTFTNSSFLSLLPSSHHRDHLLGSCKLHEDLLLVLAESPLHTHPFQCKHPGYQEKKMLWKLVLLCGLLTGPSEALLENLGNDLHNVVDKLKPIVDKGLETVDNTLQGVLQNLKVDLKLLQESEAWQLAKKKVQEAEKLVDNALSDVHLSAGKALGLKISDSIILDIKPELTADGKGINLRVPVVADVSATLPLIGQVVDLKASLDLLTRVKVETDAQTKLLKVTLGECVSDATSISLSLLDRRSTLINNLVGSVTSILKKSVSSLVQKDLCPLLGIFIHGLDVKILQDIAGKAQSGRILQGGDCHVPILQMTKERRSDKPEVP
ncbi:BPI fold-containing family A member 2 [Microcebus murinus]|uniref:BPI fold-containing family A member 2 n=1 Tax=Microcebus murinus TaxID=30608 RepID=UPI003F6B147D